MLTNHLASERDFFFGGAMDNSPAHRLSIQHPVSELPLLTLARYEGVVTEHSEAACTRIV